MQTAAYYIRSVKQFELLTLIRIITVQETLELYAVVPGTQRRRQSLSRFAKPHEAVTLH